MNDEWRTPEDLFKKLDAEFRFDFDLCASADNTKCKHWTDDIASYVAAQETPSYSTYWMNPPYSRGNIDMCMQTALHLAADFGETVVSLVRFDPSTEWFQQFVDGKALEVRMLARRVKFEGAPSAYNFPTCIVVYENPILTERIITDYFIWDWK